MPLRQRRILAAGSLQREARWLCSIRFSLNDGMSDESQFLLRLLLSRCGDSIIESALEVLWAEIVSGDRFRVLLG